MMIKSKGNMRSLVAAATSIAAMPNKRRELIRYFTSRVAVKRSAMMIAASTIMFTAKIFSFLDSHTIIAANSNNDLAAGTLMSLAAAFI
jgi:hypothetical protein